MGGGEGGGAGGVRDLDQTPTWAVAGVCTVIILISILLEKVLHHIGEFFTKRKKRAMNDALEKVKAELMILGFISLLLTFGQNYITKICIPEKVADTMLPCLLHSDYAGEKGGNGSYHELPSPDPPKNHNRRLFSNEMMPLNFKRRVLVSSGGGPSCPHGKVSLVTVNGLHQLHIFIFFLAVFHVLDSACTMMLGRAKIRGWKDWEKEIESIDYEYANDPQRFRFAHETSFVRHHSSFLNKMKLSFYIGSFFRQFFRSVRKTDYLAMRHGFITVHIAPGGKFNFQKYIKRSLEDDFKVVVGISPTLWASAVLFLLLNVNGWQTLLWISIMPLIIILLVGTKLQAIITKMALEIKERNAVVQGIPVVQVSDHHFWFGRPRLVLFLIHFTLFQNAFQLIYLLWIGYEFGWNSCFHQSRRLIISRVSLGLGVQFLCSYITLPLYALVSQMGTQMKQSIFDEQTSKALKKWRMAAQKHAKEMPHTPTSKSPATSPKAIVVKTTGRSSSRRRKSMDQEISLVEDAAVLNPRAHNDTMTGSTEQQSHSVGHGKDDEFYLVKL